MSMSMSLFEVERLPLDCNISTCKIHVNVRIDVLYYTVFSFVF
jgi:hypothetical protein